MLREGMCLQQSHEEKEVWDVSHLITRPGDSDPLPDGGLAFLRSPDASIVVFSLPVQRNQEVEVEGGDEDGDEDKDDEEDDTISGAYDRINCKRVVTRGAAVDLMYTAWVLGAGEGGQPRKKVATTEGETRPMWQKVGTLELSEGVKQGILGMCPGERRRILLPSHPPLGYLGPPANHAPFGEDAVLCYDVWLRAMKTPLEYEIEADAFLIMSGRKRGRNSTTTMTTQAEQTAALVKLFESGGESVEGSLNPDAVDQDGKTLLHWVSHELPYRGPYKLVPTTTTNPSASPLRETTIFDSRKKQKCC